MAADEAIEKLIYIHNSPMKRGLCDPAEDWRWSSAADYAGIRNGPVAVEIAQL